MHKIENLLIYCSSLMRLQINKIVNKKLIVLYNKFNELQINPYFGGHYIIYKYKGRIYGISLDWKILDIFVFGGITKITTKENVHYIMESDFKYFEYYVSNLIS